MLVTMNVNREMRSARAVSLDKIQQEIDELSRKAEKTLSETKAEVERLEKINEAKAAHLASVEERLLAARGEIKSPPPVAPVSTPIDRRFSLKRVSTVANFGKTGLGLGMDEKTKETNSNGRANRRWSMDGGNRNDAQPEVDEAGDAEKQKKAVTALKRQHERDIADVQNALTVRDEERDYLQSHYKEVAEQIEDVRFEILTANNAFQKRRKSVTTVDAERKKLLLQRREESTNAANVLQARLRDLSQMSSSLDPESELQEKLTLSKECLSNIREDWNEKKKVLQDLARDSGHEMDCLSYRVALQMVVSCKYAHRLRKAAKRKASGGHQEMLVRIIERKKARIEKEKQLRENSHTFVETIENNMEHIENLGEITSESLNHILSNFVSSDGNLVLYPMDMPSNDELASALEICHVAALSIRSTIYRTMEVYQKDKELIEIELQSASKDEKERQDQELWLVMKSEKLVDLREKEIEIDSLTEQFKINEEQIFSLERQLATLRAEAKKSMAAKLDEVEKLASTVKQQFRKEAELTSKIKKRTEKIDGVKEKEKKLRKQILELQTKMLPYSSELSSLYEGRTRTPSFHGNERRSDERRSSRRSQRRNSAF